MKKAVFVPESACVDGDSTHFSAKHEEKDYLERKVNSGRQHRELVRWVQLADAEGAMARPCSPEAPARGLEE